MVRPTLVYEAETWAVKAQEIKSEVADIRSYEIDKLRNERIKGTTKVWGGIKVGKEIDVIWA